MFSTKNLINDVKSVPIPWVFEHFCKLKTKLNGQDVKIKSMFNLTERTPSMCVYFDSAKKAYKFKDFSTGIGGDHMTLIKELYNVTYPKASNLIIEQYNDYVLHNNGGYDVKEFKQASKYKVAAYQHRSWTTSDQYFWTQFNIGSKLLEEYHVKPFASYTLAKEVDGKSQALTIRGNYIYGYFKDNGSLYKIYQPKTQDKKFLKIQDYIQGSEQLHEHCTLVIASSLKDVMSLRSLKLKVDVIAPDSENSVLKKSIMEEYKKSYTSVIALFDNDPAGIKAMQRYREDYDVAPVLLPMSKDLSDSIRDHGAKEVRNRLVPLINKVIQNTI
jgi:hypothetical protein